MEKKRKLSEDAGENGKRFCYENHITIEYLTKENDKIAILRWIIYFDIDIW